MKSLFNLLLLAGLAYGGYYVYEHYISPPKAPEQSNVEEEIRLPANRPNQLQTMVCPCCKGHGRIIDESGTSRLGYRCPICDGMGSRSIPSSQKACQYCSGMGKRETAVHNPPSLAQRVRVQGQRCPLCQGSGIEKKMPGT